MSTVQELFGAAISQDAARFDGEAFAASRFGAAKGRIARRRAARSAGIGGASVVGVGAIAFGAGQMPWSGFGFAGPGSSPSVVCTTATPDAVAEADPDLAVAWADLGGNEVWTFSQQEGTDTLATAHFEEGALVVSGFDGASQVVPLGEDGLYTFHIAGFEVSSTFGDGESTLVTIGVASSPAPDAVPMNWGIETNDGTIEGQLWLEDGVLVVNLGAHGTQRVQPSADGDYVVSAGGEKYVWHVDATSGALELVTDASEAAVAPPSPAVTCVTESPEPSESATVPVTPTSSASPTPAGSAEVADSPFACGFVFTQDESGTDALRVFGAATTDSAIRETLVGWYGNQPPATEVPDTGALAYHAAVDYDVTGYAGGVLDPALVVEQEKAFGIAFVAVQGGSVVGTIEPNAQGATYGMVQDRDDVADPVEAFLWDLDAFAPCGSSSIDGAEIYAVAGVKSGADSAYSWIKVSE